METIPGRIEKDGRSIVDRVDVSFEIIVEPSGLKSWYGYLEAEVGHDLEPGEYQLVLEDGRQGKIIIINMAIAGGSTSVPVTFHGSGPLK